MARFDVVRPAMTLFRIVPDRSVTNNQNKKFWRLMHELLSMDHRLKERVERNGLILTYRLKDSMWFDLVIIADEAEQVEGEIDVVRRAEFYMACPSRFAKTVKSKLRDRYPQATVEVVPFDRVRVPDGAEIIEYRYKRHDIFSLACNDTEQTSPVSSLLNTAYDLQPGDYMRFSVCLQQLPRRRWKSLSEYAWAQMEKKRVPGRVRFDAGKLLQGLGDAASFLIADAKHMVEDIFQAIHNSFFGGQNHPPERKPHSLPSREYDEIMSANGGRPSDNTLKKHFEPTFEAKIRLAVHSQDRSRRHMITNAVTGALRELSGDNSLEPSRVKVNMRGKVMDELNSFQSLYRDADVNIMSAKEIGKMNQYPTRELQVKYEDMLETKQQLEIDIPAEIRDGRGLHIANATVRGEVIPVHLPATPEHYDELMLPKVVIGGMGQGKTKGFAANLIVEAVNKGFGALAIDAAKGEIGDEIEAVLPPDKVRRFNLAKTVFALDWTEVKYAPRSRGMLADAVLSFFDDNTDTAGAQTQRFLTAAVFGMQTGKLREVVDIFTKEEYRAHVIEKMPDTLHRATLVEYSGYKPERRTQIAAPIFNRLNVVLGDDLLLQCFNSDDSLDLVELMSTPQAVIFDVAKRDGLTEKQIDLIVNLLTTKLSLAMQLRPEEKQFPFFAIYDEPHRFLRSVSLWESLCVESRKYRLGMVYMFHEWLQIPTNLRQIIKSALSHYFLYPSDIQTFQGLKHYIEPIEVEDALKLKRFHAINCIRVNSVIKPFIALMCPPPTKKFAKREKEAI